MENRKIVLYVLFGAWNHIDYDGTGVLGVSEDIEPLREKMKKISESQAGEYLHDTYGEFREDLGDRHYEVTDEDGNYAKFYIAEQYVEVSESLMAAMSREMEKIDRGNDIENWLTGLYESGNLDGWKYEYMQNCQEVRSRILERMDKYDDCNVPYNITLESAVDYVAKTIELTDDVLEFLWEQFGDVLIDDEEKILDDFAGFECGTHREAVWQWFDRTHSKGVAWLMFGGEESV